MVVGKSNVHGSFSAQVLAKDKRFRHSRASAASDTAFWQVHFITPRVMLKYVQGKSMNSGTTQIWGHLMTSGNLSEPQFTHLTKWGEQTTLRSCDYGMSWCTKKCFVICTYYFHMQVAVLSSCQTSLPPFEGTFQLWDLPKPSLFSTCVFLPLLV